MTAGTIDRRLHHLLTFVLLVSIGIFSPPVAGGQEQAAIRDAFVGYKTAILAGDGKAAVQHVSQSTIDYFADMQKLALYGTAAEVRAQSPVNQLQILSFRHRLELQQLQDMTPVELFAYGVDKGWIGKSTVVTLEPGSVDVSGNVGTIEVLQSGTPVGPRFRLYREGGEWRLDLVPILGLGNAAMKILAQRQGVSEEFMILSLLESVSGRKVPPTIWDPPRPRPR
jgi:hypothetical protein